MSIEKRPITTGTAPPQRVHPVIERLRGRAETNVVVLAGAGISTSPGVIDFLSPASGTSGGPGRPYSSKLQDACSLESFRLDPLPFARLAKKIWPTNRRPKLAHRFVRLLELKGLLRRHYTQNVDGVDRLAGISDKCLVETRGSFREASCIDCRHTFDVDLVRRHVFSKRTVPRCKCGGLVKPGIIFSGEPFPEKFYSCSSEDFRRCGLIVCLGTALQEEPFASLVKRVPADVPRLVISHQIPAGWEERPGDLMLIGDCDDSVRRLVRRLDWTDELEELGRLTKTLHCVPGMLSDMLTVNKEVLEGRWCDEFGETVADVLNCKIYWHQEPSFTTELRTTKKNRIMMELEDRLYYAKVASGGTRVEWSDGAVWYREFVRTVQKIHKGTSESGESSASETRATETSSTRTGLTGVMGDDVSHEDREVVTEQMLEGEWSTATGELVATISSSIVSWPNDPSVSTRIGISKQSCLTMHLDGQLYIGNFTSSRTRIKWSDGEVWHRVWNPFGPTNIRESALKQSSSEELITYAPHCDVDDTDDDE